MKKSGHVRILPSPFVEVIFKTFTVANSVLTPEPHKRLGEDLLKQPQRLLKELFCFSASCVSHFPTALSAVRRTLLAHDLSHLCRGLLGANPGQVLEER